MVLMKFVLEKSKKKQRSRLRFDLSSTRVSVITIRCGRLLAVIYRGYIFFKVAGSLFFEKNTYVARAHRASNLTNMIISRPIIDVFKTKFQKGLALCACHSIRGDFVNDSHLFSLWL